MLCSVVWWRDVAVWQSRMWLRCCLHSGLGFLRCGHSNLQPPKLSTPAPPQYKCNSSAKEIHFPMETEIHNSSLKIIHIYKKFSQAQLKDSTTDHNHNVRANFHKWPFGFPNPSSSNVSSFEATSAPPYLFQYSECKIFGAGFIRSLTHKFHI